MPPTPPGPAPQPGPATTASGHAPAAASHPASGSGPAADPGTGSAPGTVPGAVLDHVAVAVERWPDAWPRYATELGGRWSSGGLNVGFGPAQLRFANGGRIEILQPWQWEDNPFLRRFLDRHGPGPHHMTFKVPDLAGALDVVARSGFSPVGVDFTHPDWMEAFLHPRQATGIVVQLAQAAHDWASPAPEDFPRPRPGAPAAFVRATHAVADLPAALRLFQGLLGGRVVARASAPDGTWRSVDVAWAHPPLLRLVATDAAAGAGSDPLTAWLGPLPGRLHHLAFATATAGDDGGRPHDVPGVLPDDGAWKVVEPGDNLGTRLVLLSGAGTLEPLAPE